MALFIPDMAGHLFLVILLFDTFQSMKAQGKMQKPDISVNDESSHDITIACVLPESVSDGHSCNLYTGDQPQAYKEAWVRRFNAASSKLFCTFSVTKNDLFRHLQLERDVSCDYRVNTGSHSLSPRSNKYIITGQKPNITVSLKGNLIITCLIPGSVSNDTTCNLYVGEKSKCLIRAHIRKKKHTDSKCWFCQFSVDEKNLIRSLQSVSHKEVSCDYRVSSGPNSLSPRSDGYSFAVVLTPGPRSTLPPSTTVSPTEVSTVTSTSTRDTTVTPTTSLTSPLTPSTAVNPTSVVQLWQAAVCMASGVGVFWMGLTAVCLCRRTKKTSSQRPTARQDDHRQYDLVMGAMSSAGMLDSRDAGIYSLITFVPSTFLHSGPFEENGKSSENDNSDTYHIYSSIPDRPATSAQPDGFYRLLQTH
ncbi:uncharacterized protein LOC109892697 isoform X2 [Oncorhynchus kisutch]|uniref:uncharacterized protein LOC109892697 isoform X2 n=1 Tax=Oncorhynchus kisutch TaxID=8019 RepID=UPI0012DFC60B|nr:uncharacterized protein LOC109892697 isoform X2 [Oncorhynchus kisutch]